MSRIKNTYNSMQVGQEVFVAILGIPEKFRGSTIVKELEDKNIPFIRINGINAETFTFSEEWKNDKRSHFMIGRGLTNGEIACTWGHMRAVQKGITKKANWLLIIEDNVDPKNINLIVDNLKLLELPEPTLISFNYAEEYNLPTKRILTNSSIVLKKTLSVPTSTKCYAVNLLGQRYLIDMYIKHGFQGYLPDFPLFYGRTLSILISKNLRVDLLNHSSLIGDRKMLNKCSKIERIYSSKWGFVFKWLISEDVTLKVFLRFNMFRTLAKFYNGIIFFSKV